MEVSEHKCLKQLWLGFRDGREADLFALYEAFYNPLYNYGFLFVKSREVVEDVINQMFLDLWNRKERLPAVENVRAYLFTYLKREILKEKRRELKQSALEDCHTTELFEESIQRYIIQLQIKEESKARLLKAIDKLSDTQKQIIQLKFYENLSYEKIAEKLNLSKRTAYNNVNLALTRLKLELKLLLILFG